MFEKPSAMLYNVLSQNCKCESVYHNVFIFLLYCTFPLFQFPKPCWHLENRSKMSSQASDMPEYQDVLDVTDVLAQTDTAFMTGTYCWHIGGRGGDVCCLHWLTVPRQALCWISQIWNTHISWCFASDVQECKVCPWNQSQTINSFVSLVVLD